MKQSISILGGLLMAAMLSSPTLAAGPVRPLHKGESQKRGFQLWRIESRRMKP
jgi:hypothetical protein